MLTTDVFNNGIEKLIIEFEDKGFKMTKSRAMQWYEFMKIYTDDEFMRAINKTLQVVNRNPSMADILSFGGEKRLETEEDKIARERYLENRRKVDEF